MSYRLISLTFVTETVAVSYIHRLPLLFLLGVAGLLALSSALDFIDFIVRCGLTMQLVPVLSTNHTSENPSANSSTIPHHSLLLQLVVVLFFVIVFGLVLVIE